MGCQCANNTGESKSELINANSKELINTNLIKNSTNSNDVLKSSISDSVNYNQSLKENLITAKFAELQSENNIYTNQNINQNEEENYSQKMLEIINKIRENPPLYADEIENSMENITEEISKSINGKNKIIYKQRLKVELNRGVEAFIEAAKELREMNSLPPFEFKEEICIPLPKNEDDIKSSEYIKEQVKKIRKKNNINVFYRDLIKDPEVSALLMIVDDNIKNPGKKRQAVLDENFKYIGISSGFVGKNFVAYFSFSK